MRFGVSLKSSWANRPMRFCRCVHGSFGSPPPRPLLDTRSSRKSENGEPREGAVVGDEAEQAVVAGVEPLLVVVEPLAAELHRVAPLQPGQLLVDLERLGERVGVGRDVARRR